MRTIPTFRAPLLALLALSGCGLMTGHHAGGRGGRFAVSASSFAPPTQTGRHGGCDFDMNSLDKQSKAAIGVPVVATCHRIKGSMPSKGPYPRSASNKSGGHSELLAAGAKRTAMRRDALATLHEHPLPSPALANAGISLTELAQIDADRAPLPSAISEKTLMPPEHSNPRRASPLGHRAVRAAIASAAMLKSTGLVPVVINHPGNKVSTPSVIAIPTLKNFP